MKLGVLAYASQTGLGYQTRDYVKFLEPYRVMAVDLSPYNRMPIFHSWYPNAQWVHGIPQRSDIEAFLDGLDCILVAETPLNYELFSVANERKIKTIQVYNAEFLDYFRNPDWPHPTVLAAPTKWMIDKVEEACPDIPVEVLGVPVDTNSLHSRRITKLRTITHIIGRPAVNDRNGTIQFLEAAKKIKKYKYLIYLQTPADSRAIEYFLPVHDAIEIAKKEIDLEVIENTKENKDLHGVSDLLVFPRKYGGNCMPMRESLACGVPVIMTDISPNFDFLPKDWLCEVSRHKNSFFAHTNIRYYKAEEASLMRTIKRFEDEYYLGNANKQAHDIGISLGWDRQKAKYIQLIEKLCME